MKKSLFFATCLICIGSWFASCQKTETYAELVEDEKGYIENWIKGNPYDIDFGHIISKDEDWVAEVTDKILNDSIHPSELGIELGQWYKITEGNFKRLYFKINSWGHDDSSKKKFTSGKNVLVRYDSLYLLNNFDYDDISKNVRGNNLDPNSFLICYSWNPSYYANSYYSMYYGSGSIYECTSGGLAFPIRFLWEGGEASIVCPFSLVESSYSSYYYTLYYGSITYKKPTYLQQ